MKTKDIFDLSIKYLFRYRRRFLFLFSALAFGFCIVTVIVSLKDGMSDAAYNSAQGHYAGDIVFNGRHKGYGVSRHLTQDSIEIIKDEINQKIENKEIDLQRVVYRTSYSSFNIFFNGESLELKYFIGVDWKNEEPYFKDLNFADHELDIENLNENSIIISKPTALQLGAKVGDSVLVEIDNRYDQKNTIELIVGGIVIDNSIFGYYKAFTDRKTLNKLIGNEENDCSSIGLYLSNKNKIEPYRQVFQKDLENKIRLSPLFFTRDEWSNANYDTGLTVEILTIKVFISEISQILQAINLLALFLYVMMLLIILVSASVTYRLILNERTKEIATMRAIGAESGALRCMLVVEALLLASASLLVGFFLALLVNWGMSFLSFDWMPGFEIFLKNGKLTAVYKIAALLKNIAAVYIVVFIAVYFPVLRASNARLPLMLSGNVKE
ncbi:MAG: hypothetical protein Ta2B_28430 [Termitinemataceae bacterium]|nr:MAG: hypothetical protein Ta2B_28430 [Termitinemataceae bacterium]